MLNDIAIYTRLLDFFQAYFNAFWDLVGNSQTAWTLVGGGVVTFIANRFPKIHLWITTNKKTIGVIVIFLALWLISFRTYDKINVDLINYKMNHDQDITDKDEQIAERDAEIKSLKDTANAQGNPDTSGVTSTKGIRAGLYMTNVQANAEIDSINCDDPNDQKHFNIDGCAVITNSTGKFTVKKMTRQKSDVTR
jgi:hypothetical protein